MIFNALSWGDAETSKIPRLFFASAVMTTGLVGVHR